MNKMLLYKLFHPKKDTYTVQRNITHSKEFSGNQGKHHNFDPSILPYKFGLIFIGMKQKFFFFSKKKFKMADSKKSSFFKIANSHFLRKIFRWVLGLVELNDAKSIDVAQRIWP